MTATRIIDDHLELASIGTNTHAQIDTHIAAADDYVKRDGSLALTSDWDIGDGRKVLADEIRARDGAGLKLYDDGGNGIFVEDGGRVWFNPPGTYQLKIYDDAGAFKIMSDKVLVPGFTTASFRLLPYSTDIYFQNTLSTGNIVFCGNYGGDLSGNVLFKTSGKVGINTTSPTAKMDINSDIIRLRTAKTPATAGAAGNQGDICWDADYIYICTATNSWKRVAIATW